MANAPNLLNDDDSASIATLLMMAHHAFRRDIGRFATALAKVAAGDASRADALRQEWQWYRGALHGHHAMEDTHIFPDLRQQAPAIAGTIERLSADHRRIDPLLDQGDRAFAELPKADAAVRLVAELTALLDEHLAVEETELVPLLRGAKEFPNPGSHEETELYAQGFAWSSHGIAPDVLDRVYAVLPENLRWSLPAARAEFEARCVRVWGSARAGAVRTPIPSGDLDRKLTSR